MNTLYLRFTPDDHYGFPEPVITPKIVLPELKDQIFMMWSSCPYSYDSDDAGEIEEIFESYSNFNVYGTLYMISFDGSINDLKDIINNFLSEEESYIIMSEGPKDNLSPNLMNYMKADPRIIWAFCIPIWSDIHPYSIGNVDFSGYTDSGSIVSDEIVKLIHDNDFKRAAEIFRGCNILHGLDDIIRSKITDAEYSKLITFSRGGGIRKRFGV